MFLKVFAAVVYCMTIPVLAVPTNNQDNNVSRRDITGTTNVWLGNTTGDTKFMGFGILLGLPLNGSQIPDHFLSDFGFWNMRSGGSQLEEPSRGWTHGYEEFLGRYASLKSDYEVTRRHGGKFQIMVHDMWGTNSWPTLDETPMPGDEGNYTDFDNFLDAFFELCIQDGIVDDVWWDLWNEPDNGLFSDRGLDRYIEYWGHAHHKIFNEFPNGKTTGPSYGRLPNFAGDMIDWFTKWTCFIATNNSVPDIISLHFLYPDGDLSISTTQMTEILEAADVNYDGIWNVQDWSGGLELHDYLADLLGKADHDPNYEVNDTNYWPAREYPVYVYYFQKMKGMRVRTDMTDDTLGDSFAVINPDDRRVRILVGCRPNNGTWSIQINNLSSVGLPDQGDLPIQTWRFNSASTVYDPVTGPDDLKYYTHTYTDDSVFFYIGQDDPDVAYAFEFSY